MNHRGVLILAGTCCNTAVKLPMPPEHGESLHHEIELRVGAALSPLEAPRAATVLPAKHFKMADREYIAPGMRADFGPVEWNGDSQQDIRSTRAKEKGWLGGQIFDPCAAN